MRDRQGWAWAAVLAVGVVGAGAIRHRNHFSGALDLGIFDQAAWQLSRGRAHVSLIERNIFADHLSVVLVLFAPLYRVRATPMWLLLAQGVCVGLTVLPMRALARDVGASVGLATAFTVGSAPLLAAGVFDFHPSTLAVPFVALAVLYVVRDEPRRFALSAVAVLACRADLALLVLALAIVAGPKTRRWCVLIGLAGGAVAVVVPDLAGGQGGWDAHYGDLGTGPVDALAHPWRIAQGLVQPGDLNMLLGWLLPVGATILYRPRWVLAVFVAAAPLLLSQWSGTKLPWFHYGAPYAPLVIGGALHGLRTSNPRVTQGLDLRRVLPVTGIALGLLLTGPLSPRAPGSTQLWRVLSPDPERDEDAALELVDEDDGLSGSSFVLAQAMHREAAFQFPLPFAPLTGILPKELAPEPTSARARKVDVVVLSADEVADGRHEILPAGFRVVGRPDGYVVFRRP